MSDNLKRYLAIKRALCQLYPKEPQERLAQSLNVLAMFANGIVASKSTHTRQIARRRPWPPKRPAAKNNSAASTRTSG
jgi:hypothetical protein